jgi:DNA modification methylase/transcriptional regulator with XRE-family HTH domain
VAEDTQEAIAEDLGVAQKTVSNAESELRENGKLSKPTKLSTDEKREQVRTYVEDNPDASNREVAREVDCDVTHVTVGNWRDEWEIEEPSTGLDTYTNSKSEADDALDVVDTATDKTADEEVRETAQENADRLTEGETTPTTASKNVDIAEAEQKVEEERQTSPEHEYSPTITNADARKWLEGDAPQADVVVTDPPYTTDVDDVQAFAKSWVTKALNTVKRDGYVYIFVGSYTDELSAYLQELQKTDFYVQPLVWNYRNTLGRSPSDRYKRDWQAILYCRAPEAGDLNAPKTSELRSVQEVNAPGMVGDDSERHHEWQKPRQLVEQYIRHGSEQGDVVVDPFAGSGEILLAAADVGRDAYGCDIDKEAIQTATSRGCEEQ